ncbi:MAG: TRAP transporter large permease subunit [Chloroflexi bacterium]|nr:TRAP transporter large permease subunit [Chloroflexota bacterium]
MTVSPVLISLILGGFLFLLVLGIPVAFALGFVSIMVAAFLWEGSKGLFIIAANAFGFISSFTMVSVPLFLFTAEMLIHSNLSEEAFNALSRLLRRVPGGLIQGTLLGSAVFAATTGSSSANTAIAGRVTLPEMLRRKYDMPLASGSIVAGGALGILIPPSLSMILFGILAEVSIPKLFIGGVIPGILLTLAFMVYVGVRCSRNPRLAPAAAMTVSRRQELAGLWKVWPFAVLIVVIMGSIYTGFATVTEAAGMGAFATLLMCLAYRSLNWKGMKSSLSATIKTSCMVGWIITGAIAFGVVITYLGIPQRMTEFIVGAAIPPWAVIVAINVLLLLMGCFLDPASIITITVPIVVPIVMALGFDPLWFGVVFTVNMEMALLTPPVGMNLFVLKGISPPEVTMGTIIRGAWPFVVVQAIVLVITILFPPLSTWLPSRM